MKVKQSTYTSNKSQKISYSNGQDSNQQTRNLLKTIKEKNGEVIQIAITARTTIELPAHLSQEEIQARVDNYKKMHTSKI